MFFECIWQPIEFEVCLEHRHPTSQRRSTQPTETPLHSIDTYGATYFFQYCAHFQNILFSGKQKSASFNLNKESIETIKIYYNFIKKK